MNDNNDIEVKSFEEKVVEIENDDIDIFAELEYIEEEENKDEKTIVLDSISLLKEEEDFPIYFDNNLEEEDTISTNDDNTIIFNPDEFTDDIEKENIRNNILGHIQEKFSKISFIDEESNDDEVSVTDNVAMIMPDKIENTFNDIKLKEENTIVQSTDLEFDVVFQYNNKIEEESIEEITLDHNPKVEDEKIEFNFSVEEKKTNDFSIDLDDDVQSIDVEIDKDILEGKDKLEVQDLKAEKLLEELKLLKNELSHLEEPREIPVENSETIVRLAEEINR